VLHDFYDHTASDIAKLVLRLKKENVAGIILDFRNNGGGLLDQAVDLTGLFAKKGPVVQIRRSDNYIEQLGPDDTRQIYDGPLVVMVNKMSASATEIVAAALQDRGRAVIVSAQSSVSLLAPDGSTAARCGTFGGGSLIASPPGSHSSVRPSSRTAQAP